jgi:glycine/D-amino acid oxidase-like deaminating enzyme
MIEPVLPKRARVVVIGGGVIGCSVAYHLAHMGWKDVVLLERDRLTSGTTWHAAGLIVTFGSTSETSTEMRKYTRDLYARLEAETGQSTGFKRSASSRWLATPTASRSTAGCRRSTATAASTCTRSPGQVKELFPLAKTDDLLAGFYVKDDGHASPVDCTMALAKGARLQGATILENVPASACSRSGRRHRRAHPVRRHRVRVRRQLRRHVGAPARREGRA